MLVEYTYLHPRTAAIAAEPSIPAQGDAVQVMGAEDGAVYDGEIKAVAEPVFPSPEDQHVAYLLYVEVFDGQPRIHDLVEHMAASGTIALRLVDKELA
jgi:hypothetical protein